MNTLKTLGLLLLFAMGAVAQSTPDDMLIDGYVFDTNGQAVGNHEVCVSYVSNNPSLPSDSLCVITDANGFYSIFIENGSLSGPNVVYEVSTYDPCALFPQVQTRQNFQGNIDTANVNFSICPTTQPCDVSFTTVVDSSNGVYIGTFVASATGLAPFTYEWWVDGAIYNTQTVTHTFLGGTVGVYVTVTGADSCQSMAGDTLYLDGNPNVNCTPSIQVLEDSLNNVLNAELTAFSSGVAPFTYLWSNGATTETIYLEDIQGLDTICVVITDATGCTSTTCEVVGFVPNPGCSVQITTTVDSTANGVFYYAYASSGFASYVWSDGTILQTAGPFQPSPNGEVVCVTVIDANGCTASACDTLIPINNLNCSADFSYLADPNGNLVVEDTVIVAFTGSQSSSNTYLWTIQYGGQVWTSIDENLIVPIPPTLIPLGGIEAEVCLTVTDNATNCSSSTCDFITLVQPANQNCSVSITTIQDSLNPSLFYLTAFPNGGVAPFTYQWDNGSTSQSTTYQFPATGLSGACVSVTDANGCVATACDTLFPNNSNCSANIVVNTDSTGNYILSASGTGQPPFTYNWSTGETTQTIVIDPSVIFWSGIACVTVTDVQGCTASVCDTLLPNVPNCSASFTWAENNSLGLPLPAVEFTDLSSGAASWFWDFGDNTASTDQNPLHVYTSAGTYGVCLTIVNADQSCQQTFCDTVVVGNTGNGNCEATFTSSGPTPIGYTFSANVQNSNLYYYWTIDNQFVGDGFEAYAPGLTNGVHNVCLTIIDSLVGCSDTQCQTITVGSPNCFGYVSGQLYAGSNNQPLDEGVVYLITYDAVSGQLTAVDSMVVDSGNYYFFGPLACGDYMIKGAAYPGSQYYNNHIPTYYGTSPFWGFAQTVSIGQANIQITADIFLIAANNPGGPGFIGGNVNQGANKVDPGDPLEGMQVLLFDLNGSAITYTLTDANGAFSFSNLAYGTYQVYVEKLGVETVPAYVTIGPNEPSVDDVVILVSESLISTGINEVDFDGAISEIYPNPVAADASVNFNLEKGLGVDIRILDLTGRTISSFSRAIASGNNQVRFETDGLTGGYYFLNIQDEEGNFSITRKFMRVD